MGFFSGMDLLFPRHGYSPGSAGGFLKSYSPSIPGLSRRIFLSYSPKHRHPRAQPADFLVLFPSIGIPCRRPPGTPRDLWSLGPPVAPCQPSEIARFLAPTSHKLTPAPKLMYGMHKRRSIQSTDDSIPGLSRRIFCLIPQASRGSAGEFLKI